MISRIEWILCIFIAISLAGCQASRKGDLLDVVVGQYSGLTSRYDEQKKEDPKLIYAKGMKAYKSKQYKEAQIQFARFVNANRGHELIPEALFLQGESFFHQGIFLQAIRYYQQVIDRFPSNSKYLPSLFKKGLACRRVGKEDDAREIFVLIVKKYPDSEYGEEARAHIHRERKSLETKDPDENPATDQLEIPVGIESSPPGKDPTEDTSPPTIVISSHDTSKGKKIVLKEKETTITGRAVDKSGIVEVFVDNKEAGVDKYGYFRAKIYLGVGENKVVVRAMDRYGNGATETISIIREDSLPPREDKDDDPAGGKYHALIIGNDNYKYLTKLKTGRQDAEDVNNVLTSKYNFKTKLLLDAKRSDILGAINDYRKILKEDDNFLIYYAGHGEFDEIANKAYWLPIDARIEDDTNWIIVDTITSNIKRISSEHILIVADSCYSGTLTRRVESDLYSSREKMRYLQKMIMKKSRTLLASGGNEPVSDTGGMGHSVFAEVFIRSLEDIEEKYFSAEELFYRYIKEQVSGKAIQTPEYSVIRNSGHAGGDFVFERVD